MTTRRPAKPPERPDAENTPAARRGRQTAAGIEHAETRGRGRPSRHAEPVQQTTIRLTRGEWASLQAQATKETLARGERRYVTDIIRDAIKEYLARHG